MLRNIKTHTFEKIMLMTDEIDCIRSNIYNGATCASHFRNVATLCIWTVSETLHNLRAFNWMVLLFPVLVFCCPYWKNWDCLHLYGVYSAFHADQLVIISFQIHANKRGKTLGIYNFINVNVYMELRYTFFVTFSCPPVFRCPFVHYGTPATMDCPYVEKQILFRHA